MNKIKLVPRQHGRYVDMMVEIRDMDNYPSALCHLDTFRSLNINEQEIYNRLAKGETLIVNLEIIEEDNEQS